MAVLRAAWAHLALPRTRLPQGQRTLIEDLFCGQIRSRVKCLECGGTSDTTEVCVRAHACALGRMQQCIQHCIQRPQKWDAFGGGSKWGLHQRKACSEQAQQIYLPTQVVTSLSLDLPNKAQNIKECLASFSTPEYLVGVNTLSTLLPLYYKLLVPEREAHKPSQGRA